MDFDWSDAHEHLKQGYPACSDGDKTALKSALREARSTLRGAPQSEVDRLILSVSSPSSPLTALKEYLDPFPFSKYLLKVWINDDRYPDHGPAVLKAMNTLVSEEPQTSTLLKTGADDDQKARLTQAILKARGQIGDRQRTARLLRAAALYHDIGKYIVPERHPIIGWHIVQYIDPTEKNKLRDFLGGEDDLRLLMVILRDHDQFGVLSTGEASFPILLGAARSGDALSAQQRIISALMLCNLADMLGTFTLDGEATDRLLDDWSWFLGALAHCSENRLNLHEYLIKEVSRIRSVGTELQPWEVKLSAGPRPELRSVPSVCERIRRLLTESSRGWPNRRQKFSDERLIFDKLQTVFGTENSMREFALQFTHICKLDYGKRFFTGLIDACDWPDKQHTSKGTKERAEREDKAAEAVIYATCGVLKRITTTYAGMIRATSAGNLIGVELKDLAPDGAPEKVARISELILASHYPGLTWMMSDAPAWYF